MHVSRALTWFTGFPPSLVVGIGHPTADHLDYFAEAPPTAPFSAGCNLAKATFAVR
ncbi:hypothetical protein [Nocardia crassostreae]|uniref:hypothetical protein n=1 Tax=Nocardia crassostreae TaxID=53428 RepID=UPI000A95944F|nr:hypothetical protein [Nocardia crassostreae]